MYGLEVENSFDRMWLSARDTSVYLNNGIYNTEIILEMVETLWTAYKLRKEDRAIR